MSNITPIKARVTPRFPQVEIYTTSGILVYATLPYPRTEINITEERDFFVRVLHEPRAAPRIRILTFALSEYFNALYQGMAYYEAFSSLSRNDAAFMLGHPYAP